MMNIRLFILPVFFFTATLVVCQTSQDSAAVNLEFAFTDGLYTTASDLISNQPFKTLKSIDGSLVLQESDYQLKVEKLFPQGRPDLPIVLQEIEAIVIKGVPYIRVKQDSILGFHAYAGLRVRGKICYLSYPLEREEKVLIQAYNPANGRPFRQQEVSNTVEEQQRELLYLTTGERRAFSYDNLHNWTQDDPVFTSTLERYAEKMTEEQLEQLLLIYDDRNPIYLPTSK